MTDHEIAKNSQNLRYLFSAMTELCELSPERMTLSQCVFFLAAGLADMKGQPATFTEIKDLLGDKINKSLHTTYKVLLDEGRRRGNSRDPGIGWLFREMDRDDNRKKYLRLTKTGRDTLQHVQKAQIQAGVNVPLHAQSAKVAS